MNILKGDTKEVKLKTVKIRSDREEENRSEASTENKLKIHSTLKFSDDRNSLPED